MTSRTSVRSGRRWLIVFLVALVAVVIAGGSGLMIAPPAHASGGQNRVRAQDLAGGTQLQDSGPVIDYDYDPAPTSTTSSTNVAPLTGTGEAMIAEPSRAIIGAFRGFSAAEDGTLAGRDALGRFTGAGGYGADAEAEGLEQYELATGREVISDQVRSTLPDGSIRYYDGLSPNGDGTYEGIEVKSGSASLSPGQRAFDTAVNGGTPATATLNGQPIQITSVELVRVP